MPNLRILVSTFFSSPLYTTTSPLRWWMDEKLSPPGARGYIMRIAMLTTVVLLTMAGLAAAGESRASIRRDTAIPAQGLTSALQEFAKTTNLQVVYRSEVVASLKSPGAVGSLTPEETLAQLLSGSGLSYRYIDEKTITIAVSRDGAGEIGSAAAPEASQTVSFDIPSQALAGALQEFSAQSHQKIFFKPEFARGKTTQGAVGALTTDAALTQLLAGTGLVSSRDPEGMIMVMQADAKGASASSGPTPALVGAATDQGRNAPPHPTGQSAETTSLDEIVVTAQKRRETAQGIGVAISTMSGEDIATLRIQQPLDLARASPSLTTLNASSDGTPLFLIRGVGLDDFNTNNSSGVGTYIDDVFASFPGFLTGQMYDVDHVEILKGPQGTLYGKNTAGGAISIFSRRPTDQFEGYIDVSYGRWQTLEFTGAASGPISDRVNARIAATVTKQGEGYQTDIDTGRMFGKLDRGGLRAMFDIRITDTVKFLLNLHYTYDDSIPSSPSTPNIESLVPTNLGFPINGLLNSPLGGTQVRVGGLDLYKRESGDGVTGTLTVDLDGMTLSSISSFDDFSSRSVDNYDGYPAADDNWTKHFDQQQYSEELRLASASGGFFEWIVGANYLQNWYHDQDNIDESFVYGFATTISDTGKVVPTTNFVQTQQSLGLFGNVETHLSKQWTLVSGLRFSSDEVRFDGTTVDPTGLLTYANNGYTGNIVPNTLVAILDESHRNSNVSFKIGPEYHVTDKVMVYGDVATAYKGGIYYGSPAQLQADWGYAEPEHTRNIELGLKSRFLGDSMQFNAAVFDTDYKDRQSSLAVWGSPVIGTLPVTVALGNVPHARIDGAEFEFAWRPVMGLTLNVGATTLNARVTDTITNVRGLPIYAAIPDGSALPIAPKWAYSWLVRYERPLTGDLRIYGESNDRWSGKETPLLGDPTELGPSHSLGARLGAKSLHQNWDASLWATNLTDARPLNYGFAGSFGQTVSWYQKPRAYGINVVYKF